MLISKVPIALLLCMVLCFNCLKAEGNFQQNQIEENQRVYYIIKQAVEYDWLNNDYKKELKNFYMGSALENTLDSLNLICNISTDWYTLTFLLNCHIVYNNGNTAIASVLIKEVDITNNDEQIIQGIYALQQTSLGWRISEMYFYQSTKELS